MSAISLKSITGITSITTPAGADNQLTLHTNNTTEAVKLDGAGNFHFHNHLNITGVSTASNFKTGSTNVHSTGVELANINTGGGTATFGGGITVAGAIDANGDLDVDGHTNLDNGNVAGIVTFNSGAALHMDGGQLLLKDRPDGNSNNLFFGTGGKAVIFHDGTNFSQVNNTGHFYLGQGVGNKDLMLYAQASGNVLLQQNTGVRYVKGVGSDASVQLFFNNNLKLNTTNTGIDVTGSITADDLRTDNSQTFYLTTANDFRFRHTGGSEKLRITSDGKILINQTTSNWGTTTANSVIQLKNGVVWDYAGVQLDIGHNYYYNSSGAYKYIRGGYAARQTFHNNDGSIAFWSGGTGSADGTFTWSERLRIYNDGVVAIGQSSKSSTVGAGNLDIQGNATSCIIEMGNPFPTWQGGIVPNFRITSTNSGYVVDFESVWGGDNLLHKHLSFAGGNTDVYDGTYNHQIARFDGSGRLMLNSTSITNTYDYLTVKRRASGFGEVSMSVDANTSTSSAANAFIFTKSKHTYWNGYGFQSSHGHIGAIVGMRDATAMNSSHKIRIEMGGTHINQSEVKTWDFQNDGDLSISDGNLVVASGHGIDFSANGNASGMASELLDIYEEGTWTPYIYPMSSSIPVTYSHQSGKYTRVGNVVHFQFKLQVSNITGNRNQGFGINGFPFNNTNSQAQINGEFYGETWSGEIPTTIKWIGNTNRGVCYFYTSSQHYQASSMLDINVSSSMLMGAGHYFTH